MARLRRRGREAGLSAVGIAPATPMEEARRALEQRKAAGLDGGMQFTYRNPARSTDPGRVLPGAAALVVGAWWYGGRARALTEGTRRTMGGPVAGWPGTRGGTTTPTCAPPSASWPRCCERPVGRPGWWPTTTPSWTGPQLRGPAWGGTAKIATSCCPEVARGSSSALSSPTPRCPPTSP